MRVENTNNATDKQIWLFPWHAKQDNKAITKKDISSKMPLRVIIQTKRSTVIMIYKNNQPSFYHGNNIDT